MDNAGVPLLTIDARDGSVIQRIQAGWAAFMGSKDIKQSVNENGDENRVLNKKETMLASQKQDAMKVAFKDWIFKDRQRRERLVKVYNERFNSIRPREYDGSHLTFPGMNPEIELRPHQKHQIANPEIFWNM